MKIGKRGKSRILCIFLSVVLLIPLSLQGQAEEQFPFPVHAKSIYLIECETGQVLLSKNEEEIMPVASITKIMTILLTLEAIQNGKISSATQVVVSKHASGMGGSQVFLDADSLYTVGDLLKSTIIASANDAAVALAETLGGSEENFALLMTERAKELGCTHTQFFNATGLPCKGQYTCARDVAIMSQTVLEHPLYFTFSGIWMDEITHPSGRVTGLTNTNRLIRFYEGADGVKTGSTNEAGYCISATAKRGEYRYLAVVLGCPSSAERFALAQKLLDYGFQNYEYKTLLKKNEKVSEIIVTDAREKVLPLYAKEEAKVLLKKGDTIQITQTTHVPAEIQAPIEKGQVLGCIRFYKENQQIAQIDLCSQEKIEKHSFLTDFVRLLKIAFTVG